MAKFFSRLQQGNIRTDWKCEESLRGQCDQSGRQVGWDVFSCDVYKRQFAHWKFVYAFLFMFFFFSFFSKLVARFHDCR